MLQTNNEKKKAKKRKAHVPTPAKAVKKAKVTKESGYDKLTTQVRFMSKYHSGDHLLFTLCSDI